jgi:dipeptidyl aminopeptidase/acylaminoacyl peptidase
MQCKHIAAAGTAASGMVRALVAVAAIWGGASTGAMAADAPVAAVSPSSIPVSTFFKRPSFDEALLSPNGRYLAAIVPVAESGREGLAVVDLEDTSKTKLVAHFDDADIDRVYWVNDDRLVMQLTDRRARHGMWSQDGYIGEMKASLARLFAVDRQGKEMPVPLILRKSMTGALKATGGDDGPSVGYRLVGTIRDGSEDILVEQVHYTNAGEPSHVVPTRVTSSGGHHVQVLVDDAPPDIMGWAYDRNGVPRAALAVDGERSVIYVRSGADKGWTKLMESPYVDDVGVRGVGTDGTVYLVERSGHEDTASLVAVGPGKGAESARSIVGLKGYDFSGRVFLADDGALLGVQFRNDARGSVWFDESLKKAQTRIDQLLPGGINLISCERCKDAQNLLVMSYSDHQPATYRIYDTKNDRLIPVGASRPWVDRRLMADTDFFTVPARDGLALPTYVTRPRGVKGPAPAIVLVHGGPYLRGREWGWSADAQFLASRGYVVIETEYRGSTGFGHKHFQAGWKQWGLAMEDDLADVAGWAAKQNIADPKRMCIAGASYGGYATLMGLARYGDLFRCGVEWVGVTDLDYMHDLGESDLSAQYKRYGFPVLVGDPKADAQQFANTSPLRQAASIKRPLLMAYGSDDLRVPIAHGHDMRDALQKSNPNVEWIEYVNEGHGWSTEADDVDFWTHVEAFLDKNLKHAVD